MWCDLGKSCSRNLHMWHFQFSIWLKCSFGKVHFAENLTWIGPVVPGLWAIERFSEQWKTTRNSFPFLAISLSMLPTSYWSHKIATHIPLYVISLYKDVSRPTLTGANQYSIFHLIKLTHSCDLQHRLCLQSMSHLTRCGILFALDFSWAKAYQLYHFYPKIHT